MHNAYDVKPRVSILCRLHIVLYSVLSQYKEKVVWLCKTSHRFYSARTVFVLIKWIKLSNRTHSFATVSSRVLIILLQHYCIYISLPLIIWEEFWGEKILWFNENFNFQYEIILFALLNIENCVEHDIVNMNIFHTLHFQILQLTMKLQELIILEYTMIQVIQWNLWRQKLYQLAIYLLEKHKHVEQLTHSYTISQFSVQ